MLVIGVGIGERPRLKADGVDVIASRFLWLFWVCRCCTLWFCFISDVRDLSLLWCLLLWEDSTKVIGLGYIAMLWFTVPCWPERLKQLLAPESVVTMAFGELRVLISVMKFFYSMTFCRHLFRSILRTFSSSTWFNASICASNCWITC